MYCEQKHDTNPFNIKKKPTKKLPKTRALYIACNSTTNTQK